MQTLEYLYENSPKIAHFLPRKLEISSKYSLLFGPPLCGKSTLALAHIWDFKSFLYVDLDDIRARVDLKSLAEFISARGIDALCIDNATSANFCELNSIKQKCPNADIIIISKDKALKIEHFCEYNLAGLDYEEFIAFFSKNYDESTIFTHFMSLGNSPKMALAPSSEYLKHAYFAILSPLQRQILALIAPNCGENFSALGIFNTIKQEQKISKDSFYSALDELAKLGVIGFLDAFSKAGNSRLKRVYFSDFALRGVFSFSKNPRTLIANMLHCELALKDVYFTPALDFYLPNENLGIIVAPFLSQDLCLMRVKKHLKEHIKLGLNEIIIISNSGTLSVNIDGVRVSILPFWRFVAGHLG